MGQKDLGTVVIMSRKDAVKLEIKTDKLEPLRDYRTPKIIGFSPEKKLRKNIEMQAKKCGADLAIITCKGSRRIIFREMIDYDLNFYKYPEEK